MENILVAMSHNLTAQQVESLNNNGYDVVISEEFVNLGCNRLAPTLTSSELLGIATEIVQEAIDNNCSTIAMTGEPMLTFLVWERAEAEGLEILQSTTERKTSEFTNQDGTVTKTQIFFHVQWRKLER